MPCKIAGGLAGEQVLLRAVQTSFGAHGLAYLGDCLAILTATTLAPDISSRLVSEQAAILSASGCQGWRPMQCIKASAGSLTSGLHRQHAKGFYGLRKTGPALRGFSGESSACNPRCIVKYASALELARSQVMMSPSAQQRVNRPLAGFSA